MTGDIIIRPPEDSERGRFYEVYCTGIPGVDDISEERFEKWWARSRSSGEIDNLWRVAVLDDEIVGVVINNVNDELGWGFVWELSVIPEMRGRGIGTRLIKESERLLLDFAPDITHLAIGVKTDNLRAIGLYEKLNYGIYFLILHLRGPRWKTSSDAGHRLVKADPSMMDSFLGMIPDAYWATRTQAGWEDVLKEEGFAVVDESDDVLGYMRHFPHQRVENVTEIHYSVREGYGPAVLDACMDKISTDLVELWVQDRHQDILKMLYERGFQRIESEFLLRKRIT